MNLTPFCRILVLHSCLPTLQAPGSMFSLGYTWFPNRAPLISYRHFHSTLERCLPQSTERPVSKLRSKRSAASKKEKSTFRADRVLSNRGWGSRSECFDILKERRVFLKTDDGPMQRLVGPKEKIPMNAGLWIDGKVEVPMPPPLLRIYHKPKWVLSAMKDTRGRKTLGDLSFIEKMHPVGRLDYDTSGLLLFSSNGDLTQTLLHPNHEIEKEYVALVPGSVNEEELREKLAAGVSTSIGTFQANLIETKQIPNEKVENLIKSIKMDQPPEYDLAKLEEKGYLFYKDAKELSEVRLVVQDGKYRMVRRILANVGYPVISLRRERLGDIRLGDLASGKYRDMTTMEEEWAQSLLQK